MRLTHLSVFLGALASCACDGTELMKHTLHLETPATLDFGRVVVGRSSPQRFQIKNAGELALELTVEATPPIFAAPTSLALAPNATLEMEAAFAPAALGEVNGELVFLDHGARL